MVASMMWIVPLIWVTGKHSEQILSSIFYTIRHTKNLVFEEDIVLRFYFYNGNTSDYGSIVLGWWKQADRGQPGPAEQTCQQWRWRKKISCFTARETRCTEGILLFGTMQGSWDRNPQALVRGFISKARSLWVWPSLQAAHPGGWCSEPDHHVLLSVVEQSGVLFSWRYRELQRAEHVAHVHFWKARVPAIFYLSWFPWQED